MCLVRDIGSVIACIESISLRKKAANGDTTRLNIESLVSGVYLVECQNEAGGKSVVKFVKQ
jgi:hypothetical protein